MTAYAQDDCSRVRCWVMWLQKYGEYACSGFLFVRKNVTKWENLTSPALDKLHFIL